MLEEAVGALPAWGTESYGSIIIPLQAEAYLVLGRIAEAREKAEQAVALAQVHQQRGWEAWRLKQLGDVHAHEPADAKRAWDAYQRALALAGELGMRPLLAHCHLSLGALQTIIGGRDERREHLGAAKAMYREMNMPSWLEKAEFEIKALT